MAAKIFISYADQDEKLFLEFLKHLFPLQSTGLVEIWHRGDIAAGQVFLQEIDVHIQTADIILLLISPDFMSSSYLVSSEMHQALQRHARGEVVIVPLLLRPADWRITPLDALQYLPRDARPITLWPNLDKIFVQVVEDIRTLLMSKGNDYLSSFDRKLSMKTLSDRPKQEKSFDESVTKSVKNPLTFSQIKEYNPLPQQEVRAYDQSNVENIEQHFEGLVSSQIVSAQNHSQASEIKQVSGKIRKGTPWFVVLLKKLHFL